MHIYVESKENA